MMYFCTIFDSNYASKGIALYLSLKRQTNDFVLYVMGMDRKCQEILDHCDFKNMVVECIDDIENLELKNAEDNRSRAEFCWTCGAFFTDYFLHKFQLPEITYIDSDLMFFSSPQVIFDELRLKNASIGLAPHFTKYTLFGKYCVQFVYFKNDKDGSDCLRWWRDECLKWCYCKMEDGKYADQKYLDYFEEKFDNVEIIENRGVGIANWNVYNYSIKNNHIMYDKKSWPIVFFHYSGFSISINEKTLLIKHTMYLKESVRNLFVFPYSELLAITYSKYLHTEISDIIVKPVDLFINCIKGAALYLNVFLPVDRIITQFFKIKYKEKRVPYNEPKVLRPKSKAVSNNTTGKDEVVESI